MTDQIAVFFDRFHLSRQAAMIPSIAPGVFLDNISLNFANSNGDDSSQVKFEFGMLFWAFHFSTKLLCLSVLTAFVSFVPHPLAWQIGAFGVWLFLGSSVVFVTSLVLGMFCKTRCPFCSHPGTMRMDGKTVVYHCRDCGLTKSSLFSIGLKRMNKPDR